MSDTAPEVHAAGLSTLPSGVAGGRERLTITDIELFYVCPPLQEGILPAAATHVDFDQILAMHLHINDAGVRGMVNAIAAGACDVFNLGAGSTHDFLGRAYLAGESGIPVWHGSAHELGVLDAAMLHACAAAPNCTYPSDILSHQRVHNLLTRPIEFRDSYATVPDGPGLGVELDEDALRRYAVSA